MAFGLRNAAQTCQRFMDDILRGFGFCFAHLDEIFVFSRSLIEHEQHLWTLFDQLQKFGILINRRSVFFEYPRSPSSVTRCPPRVPNLCNNE
jgi:hypothetical protein